MDTASGTTTVDLLEPESRMGSPAAPARHGQSVRADHRVPAVAPEVRRRTGGVGPCVEFVELSTRWRGHVSFAAALDPNGHREQGFDALSLPLPAGRITVLLGAQGAGKTLLACHLLGVAAPDSGAVLVDGQSMWQLPERARTELIGAIGVMRGGVRIQDSAILDSCSVVDNLVLRLARRGPTESAEQHARHYPERFDLTAVAEQLPTALDPGARRRLALVLALAADPPLVVIDEPGQAFDLHHYQRLTEAIKSWQARTG